VGSIEVPFLFLAAPRDPADIPDHIDGKQLRSLADKRRACYDDSIPLLASNEKTWFTAVCLIFQISVPVPRYQKKKITGTVRMIIERYMVLRLAGLMIQERIWRYMEMNH
jgi:hypothetical protein